MILFILNDLLKDSSKNIYMSPRAAPIAIDTGPSSSRTCCTCENYDI